MKENPWKLSPRECDLMGELADSGLRKIAADNMGVCDKTYDTLLRRAKAKMEARSTIEAVLVWDRWARTQ